MLVFSPAFVLFPVLNPLGTFRKEILFFTLLASICIYLASRQKKISNALLIGLAVSSVIIVLSHEMLVAYFPYIICAFIIREKGFTANTKNVILALIPAILIAASVFILAKGNPQVVIDICNSLKTSAPSDCTNSGAIFSLGQDIQSAHTMVLQRITSTTLLVYALTTALGFLPIILFIISKRSILFQWNKKTVFWLILLIFSAIICSLPLFWVAVDYGRFINIHIMCLSMLALLINAEGNEVTQKLSYKHIIPLIISILFVICWRLIFAGATINDSFPFIETIKLIFR
jgi:hypothetical protein